MSEAGEFENTNTCRPPCNASCPKCGSQDKSMSFIPSMHGMAEFISMRCKSCDYRWNQPPLTRTI